MSHANATPHVAPLYDYIIAGAGGAGLSLLHYLLDSPILSNKQILVIDQSLNKTNDRTWCFWEIGDHEFESLVQHRWDAISIHAESFSKELPTSPFSYKMIQGIDFYNYVMTAAKLKPNVHWVEAAITNITEANADQPQKEVLLEWDGGSAKAKLAFTSILPFQMNNLASASKYDSRNQSSTHLPFLWQHFKGRTIAFDKPVFDQKVARLMDFNVPQHGATAFMYLLPINEMQALVEYTLFSDQILEISEYDKVLNEYLSKHYPDFTYTIQHEEIGAIPMTQQTFSNFKAPIYPIGALGLAIKASTGYAFKFIQQQCKSIVAQLEQGAAINTNVHNTRHRFYDAALLHVLFYHKMEGAEIFKRIFAKNNAATVFKFLSNTSTLWEDIQIMRSLPTRIFLPAAIAVLWRRG
ncbi:MAG: lycopene cyclase family protein [Sediminibacterium sp.]|jgi:lycopene beta-cyclase|nr:lycopene cyclase family protein [Sediminibacterium sp.]